MTRRRHGVRGPVWRLADLRLAGLRLADWPFALKMGFVPAVAAAALFVIVSFATSALDRQAAMIDAVVTRDMDVATRLSASATRLQQVDAGLYRVLALQAAHSAERPVDADIAELLTAIDRVLTELGSYAESLPAGAKQAGVRALMVDLGTYRGAIEVVGSMLELDFASAVQFVRPFDGHTRIILAALSGLVDESVREAGQRATRASDDATRARELFVAAAAAVSAVLATLALGLTRAIVRSVGDIARATVLVAKGDRALDIGRLARRDELGAIVESLQSFQDNVARVAFLAHHDALTALPNRTLFNERLHAALARIDRGHEFAVLCLDLDRFKAVNDTLGHPVGDQLLRQVGERLCACVRDGDTVARLGGDEFAIIELDAGGAADAAQLAERIVARINETFELDGHRVSVGCSVGIAMAPADGAYAAKLLKNADTALYRAKTEGRNTHRFFEAAMDHQLQLRRELEIDMRRAIAAEEFEVHYQPLVRVETMRISGFEALLRWRHDKRGVISPGDFIPVAEETGLIVALGEWVLTRACLDAAAWPEPIKVAVNLSPVQFKDSHLLQVVLHALELSRLAPDRLELEITESVLLHRSEPTLEVLTALRARGVRIAMDDFGTGYSSLSYLRSFPFDKIKIDQSFIRDLSDKEDSVAIVRAVTGLSGSLGVATTAEGVETRAQFDRLAAEGCTEVQGFYFGRPGPVSDVPRVLSEFTYRVAPILASRAPPAREQPALEQQAPEQPAPEQHAREQPALEQQAPEQPAPEQHALEQQASDRQAAA